MKKKTEKSIITVRRRSGLLNATWWTMMLHNNDIRNLSEFKE